MGANLVHQSYNTTSSKCYSCKIARLMANLAIFSTLWSFSQFFQKYATFSLFFDNPSRSVFLLRFMSRSQTKILFFSFLFLYFFNSMPLSLFFGYNPLHSVFLPMFMSINPKKKSFFLFLSLYFHEWWSKSLFCPVWPHCWPPVRDPSPPSSDFTATTRVESNYPKKSASKRDFLWFRDFSKLVDGFSIFDHLGVKKHPLVALTNLLTAWRLPTTVCNPSTNPSPRFDQCQGRSIA